MNRTYFGPFSFQILFKNQPSHIDCQYEDSTWHLIMEIFQFAIFFFTLIHAYDTIYHMHELM